MEVPAGKWKVMEKFFSPVAQRRSGRGAAGASEMAHPRGRAGGLTRRNCLPSHSSFSSTSLSSEASLEGGAYPPRPVRREQTRPGVQPARESSAELVGDGREERGRASPPPDRRQGRAPRDRARPTELRRARSMEFVATLGPPRGGSSPPPCPGAPGEGRRGWSGQELASERRVRQKATFSRFLDEITAQVFSPASLSFLRPQDSLARGDGEPGGTQAGAASSRVAWQEEDEEEGGRARHRREGRSASPQGGRPSPGPRRTPKRQLTDQGPRQPEGARGPETGQARARPVPLEAGQVSAVGAAWRLDSPGRGQRQEGGGGGKLTDSASSLEMGPVHHGQTGRPARDAYGNSSSSPEEPWVAEIQPQAAGLTQEMLTDAHHLRYIQEESSSLERNLGSAARRTEKMDADFKTSHGHLETELQRAQADLEELRAKFQRLQENYSNTRQVNELMEEKLYTISQSMETERKDLNQQISELTNRLTNAQRTICSLENIHPPRRVAALLPTAATQHGHDLLEAGVDHSPFLDVPVYTPPAPFKDEVPGTGAEGPDRPATPPVVEKPQPPASDGLHRPEGQASRSGREEPARPPRARLALGPRRQTAFTPWSRCLEADHLLGWPNPGKGGEAGTAEGKPEEGRPPSEGLLALSPHDPFGPIDPGEQLTEALQAASEGGPRELSPKGTFRNRESLHLRGEVSSSGGSEDEAAEGWAKTLAGKAQAGAPKGFSYQLGRSGPAKLSQCRPPPGLEGKGDFSLSPGLPGANRSTMTPPGLSGSWAHQWSQEVGRQLSRWGRHEEEEEEGTARRPRAAAGRNSGGGEGTARGILEPTVRARPSPEHPPATAPRKHRNQAATRE